MKEFIREVMEFPYPYVQRIVRLELLVRDVLTLKEKRLMMDVEIEDNADLDAFEREVMEPAREHLIAAVPAGMVAQTLDQRSPGYTSYKDFRSRQA